MAKIKHTRNKSGKNFTHQNKTTLFWRKKAKINLHQNFPIYGIMVRDKPVIHIIAAPLALAVSKLTRPIGPTIKMIKLKTCSFQINSQFTIFII